MNNKPKILCVIPISKNSLFNHEKIGSTELFWLTFEAALDSKLIDKIVVCSDDVEIKEKIKDTSISFLERPEKISGSDVCGEDIIRYTIDYAQKAGNTYDILVYLEITHPFRKKGFIDKMIGVFLEEDLDTIFTAHEDKSPFWKFNGQSYEKIDECSSCVRSKFRSPLYKELKGLGAVTKIEFIINGDFFGKRVGIIPVREMISLIDIKSKDDLWLAKKIVEDSVH